MPKYIQIRSGYPSDPEAGNVSLRYGRILPEHLAVILIYVQKIDEVKGKKIYHRLISEEEYRALNKLESPENGGPPYCSDRIDGYVYYDEEEYKECITFLEDEVIPSLDQLKEEDEYDSIPEAWGGYDEFRKYYDSHIYKNWYGGPTVFISNDDEELYSGGVIVRVVRTFRELVELLKESLEMKEPYSYYMH